jgi:hypothetical protein
MRNFAWPVFLVVSLFSVQALAWVRFVVGVDIIIPAPVIAVVAPPEVAAFCVVGPNGYFEQACIEALPVTDPVFLKIRRSCFVAGYGYDVSCINEPTYHFWSFVHYDRLNYADHWDEFDSRYSDRVADWNLRFRVGPAVSHFGDDRRRGGDFPGEHRPHRMGDLDEGRNPSMSENHRVKVSNVSFSDSEALSAGSANN